MRLAASFLLLAACNPSASATFPFGVEASISGASISVPEALQDPDAAGRIRTLPCGPMGMCPASAEFPVVCEADVCDPAPLTIERQVGDVEIEDVAGDAEVFFRTIDTVEILDVDYQIRANTLGLATQAIEIYWGPIGAAALDANMGVVLLGTLPPIEAGATGEGAMMLDPAGVAAFSQHFETEGSRFRFFARTELDIEPGGQIPAGDLDIAVRVTLRASGKLL